MTMKMTVVIKRFAYSVLSFFCREVVQQLGI